LEVVPAGRHARRRRAGPVEAACTHWPWSPMADRTVAEVISEEFM
jgi:hypothetical protein